MKHLITFIFVAISVCGLTQDSLFHYETDYAEILKKTNDPRSDLNYEKLLKRFNSNDSMLTSYEVLSLLIGFTDKEHIKPYAYLDVERDIYDKNDEGKFTEALAKADSFLLTVPVSQTALIEKSYALMKLDRKEEAAAYLMRYEMIMGAMASSGDGTTPETAFFALGPMDGQNFLTKYIGASIGTMGSGRDKYGNFVDILEMHLKDEETGEELVLDIYFQIEHATKTMFGDLNIEDELMKAEKKSKKKTKKK